MAQTPFTLRRWTRAEYDRLVELGVFEGEHLELIGGELVVGEPQPPIHAAGITRADYAVRAVLPRGWMVRVQAPVSLDDESEPEPDVMVCSNPDRDAYGTPRTKPILVVEVAESSLGFDLGEKAALYAEVGVPEYWVVNLVDETLEVFRDPESVAYRTRKTLRRGERIRLAAVPDVEIEVGELLP